MIPNNTGVYNVRKNEKTRSPYPLYQTNHKRYVLRIVKTEKFYENYSYRGLQKMLKSTVALFIFITTISMMYYQIFLMI